MFYIKVIDLFCGAGGLSLGFQQAGFEILGGVDFQQDAINTYKHNFINSNPFCGDISSITDEQIKNIYGESVDVIIGGPPCQGFSAGNRQQIENDPRNKFKNIPAFSLL